MRIIIPRTITDGMFVSGTVTEDPTTAWNAATNYAVDAEAHVVATHRVYKAGTAGTGGASPQLNPSRWKNMRPTNRWSAFDYYKSTMSLATGTLTWVINVGFMRALFLAGLQGTSYSITIKDGPGGNIFFSDSGNLRRGSTGWVDYLFGQRDRVTRRNIVLTDLPVHPNAELTVSITAASGQAGLGIFNIGEDLPFIDPLADFGAVQDGLRLVVRNFSYAETNNFGELEGIVLRPSATDLRGELKLPPEFSQYTHDIAQRVMNLPCAYLVSELDYLEYASVFGLLKECEISLESGVSTASVFIEGTI